MNKIDPTKALPLIDSRETAVGEYFDPEVPNRVTDNCLEEIVGGGLCSCRLESARETTVEREPCQAVHVITHSCAGALACTGLGVIWSFSTRADSVRAVLTFAMRTRRLV